MRRTILIIVIAAVALLSIGAVYYALDPSTTSAFPRCTFLQLTGYKCPGCGSQRAIHALLHGDVAAAFKYNAILFIFVPWIVLCLYTEVQRKRNPRLYARMHAPVLLWALLIILLLWWLLRNIFGW